MTKDDKNKFVLIDGNAIMHRAYHAMPRFEVNGRLVNAIYGFVSILFSTIDKFKPDYLAVAFDVKGPTFRDELFKEYKAKRVKAPDEFYEQIPEIWNFVQKMEIPLLSKKGYEADDVIGTISKRIDEQTNNLDVIILTGDQDTLQLVNGNIKVAMPKMGRTKEMVYDSSAVKGRFGLSPEQIIDYKALSGDSSDNIPGVRGVGDKTAQKLLSELGTVEDIYKELKKNREEFQGKFGKSVTKKLEDGEDLAELSKQLATIKTDLELDFKLSDAKTHDFDEDEIKQFLQKYRFRSLIRRLPESKRQNGQQESLF